LPKAIFSPLSLQPETVTAGNRVYNPPNPKEEKTMRNTRLLLTLVTISILWLTSCVPTPTPKPDEDLLATSVAATMKAADLAGPGEKAPPGVGETPTAEPSMAPTLPPKPPVLRIVYTDGGNVWLIEGAKPPAQLTSSGGVDEVLISSDGMKIAYIYRVTPDANAEVRSINADGTGDTSLITPAQFDALYPLGPMVHNDLSQIAFLPETHLLMLNTRGIPPGPGLFKHDNLLQLDADTGVLTTIFPPSSGGDFTLSPTGSQVAIVLPTSISIANSDGSGLFANLVTYTAVMTYSEFQYYAEPVWKGDSSALGVVIPSSDPFNPPTSGTIWRISSGGGPAVNLGTISGGFYAPPAFSASLLSPNLNRVAFLRDTPTPNVYDLYLANADGSGEAVYANGDIQWLGWAPDNTHFVYTSGGPMNLQLGMDGGAPTPIGSCSRLRWINNTRFLCLSGSLGSWTLMRGQIGGPLTAIVSPAGDFVAFDFDL
jgi:hypothetical protein